MIQSITLNLAQENDLSEIYSLCQEIAVKSPFSKWGTDYPTRDILQADIQEQSLYKVLDSNRIVSTIQIRPWAEFMKNSQAEDLSTWDKSIVNPCALGRFCVSPGLQGKGMGRRILLKTLEKAKELGYDGAFFHVVEGNDPAIHLYNEMGFHYTGEVFEYGFNFLCYEMKF